MPWRGIFVVAAGLLVGGCAFSAYQVASLTATGVSYAFSGKGLGDHALSLATKRDCATLRILQGKPVCVDYGSDFESAWSAMASTWRVPDVLRQPVAVADAQSVETPLTALDVTPAHQEPAGGTLAVQAVAMTVRRDAAPGDARVARSGLDFDGLVATGGRIEAQDGDAPWLISAADTPGLDFDGLTPGGGAVGGVSEMQVATLASSRPAIYLVLGSFRIRANADALRARHAGKNMVVMKTLADDRATFRVLTGPIAAAVLPEARVDLAKAGFKNAWAVQLCSGSLALPPCEPVLQQASLPER